MTEDLPWDRTMLNKMWIRQTPEVDRTGSQGKRQWRE